MRDWVSFLWHYVLCDGVEIDPMKTVAVQDCPTPHTVKDVRALLRIPLMGLTKKDARLIWDDDCQQAFLALKKALG